MENENDFCTEITYLTEMGQKVLAAAFDDDGNEVYRRYGAVQVGELLDLECRLTSIIWWNNHQDTKTRYLNGEIELDAESFSADEAKAAKIESLIPLEELSGYSDMEWGLILGQVNLLHWMESGDFEGSLDS